MKNRKIKFFSGVLIILAITYVAIFGLGSLKGSNKMRYGIDIRGGVEAIYEPVDLDRKPTGKELESARTVINTRLDSKNITDREVSIDKNNGTVIVRFPWKSDEAEFNPEKAIAELGETAKLTFRDSEGNILVDGTNVSKSIVRQDELGEPLVILEFDSTGTSKFATATKKLIGQPIIIFMDEKQIFKANVQEAIPNGEARITGIQTEEEAKDLSAKINAGSLPFSMETTNHNSISPTLGSGALRVMIIAALVAFAGVCIFMISFYRLPGFISCIALLLQMAGQLLMLSIPQFTLTLPGIAGIILSLGMGVDANIIISARISEELQKGRTIPQAIQLGYKNAFSSVFDGNFTSAIVAVILMVFGSGTMLSFGYTLLTGIVMNFVAGIYTSKALLNNFLGFKWANNIKLFKVKKESKTLPLYEKRRFYYLISAAIIVIGIVFIRINGVKLDTQFAGGAILTYTYDNEVDTDAIAQTANQLLNRTASVSTSSDLATNQKHLVVTLAGNKGLAADDQDALTNAFKENNKDANIQLYQSYIVEPYIGKQALSDSIIAIVLASIFIVIYVWIRFKAIGGLSAGVTALIALFHDIILVFIAFVLFKIPLNDAFVAVTLTIIGYSINDTIVTYDRIRENSHDHSEWAKDKLVNISTTQTLARSINTSITTTLCMVSILVFSTLYGIESIQEFALPMLFGLISGCYSSVCLAGPLWVSWQKYKERKKSNVTPAKARA